MATYVKFIEILRREGKPRRFTYLCGDQGVLVEQAADVVKRAVDVEEMDYIRLVAGQDPTARIWAEMNQHALDPAKHRLVQVRSAEKLGDWSRFEEWMMSRQIPNIHVLMVADEKAWPVGREPEARARMIKSSSAAYVECSLPKSNPEKAAVEIILSWSRMDQKLATYLAERTGYDLARCRDVCRWTNRLKGTITTSVIDVLTVPNPKDSYVEALVKMDRRTAIMQAAGLAPREVRVIVGQLAARLTDLERINRAMQKALVQSPEPGKALAMTAQLAEVSIQRAKALWAPAKHYDSRAVRRRAELLMRADEHWTEPGVLEVLAAQW